MFFTNVRPRVVQFLAPLIYLNGLRPTCRRSQSQPTDHMDPQSSNPNLSVSIYVKRNNVFGTICKLHFFAFGASGGSNELHFGVLSLPGNSLLGSLGPPFGPSWAPLGSFWIPWSVFWNHIASLWPSLGAPWCPLGSIWEILTSQVCFKRSQNDSN